MEELIKLNKENIDAEHICCAISDKKCIQSYENKKKWLKKEFENGYVFRRINARAKVFMEYCPAEKSWVPIDAPDYLLINCFWVSGKYKKQGYGKELLRLAIKDAKEQNKNGIATIVGKKKFHFMSDGKWFLKQGFQLAEENKDGFCILIKKTKDNSIEPKFKISDNNYRELSLDGLTAFYSDRCPFAGYHVENSLVEAAKKRSIPLKIVKLDTIEKAKNSPSPATIFSLFYKGKFVSTDISICMDSKFDKIFDKIKN